jgi:hypothetical protein
MTDALSPGSNRSRRGAFHAVEAPPGNSLTRRYGVFCRRCKAYRARHIQKMSQNMR